MTTESAEQGLLSPSRQTPMEVEHARDRASLSSNDGSLPSRPQTNNNPGLPITLKFLFALNGFSLALPMTALLYIVNTRVALSLTLLPAYGAVAFLPNSLRPLYAVLSSTTHRDQLISLLLLSSAASLAGTALIPRHGVVLCFLAALVRGVTSAWPEFLLGLTLLDYARLQSSAKFDETCGRYQAQAATARHVGSLTASVGALAIIGASPAWEAHTMNWLFFLAAAANVTGAAVAIHYQIGRQHVYALPDTRPNNYASISSSSSTNDDNDNNDDVETGQVVSTKFFLCRQLSRHNVLLVLLLQISVILLALQAPLQALLTRIGWQILMGISLLALIVTFGMADWKPAQKVGLFLILRHLVPSASYLMSSYFYDIFATAPYLLQLLSLVDMAVSTVSAWSYGQVCARFSNDTALPRLIVAMTLLASLLSFTQVWLVRVLPTLQASPWLQFVVVVFVQGLVNWSGTWNFLPDVVLATTSVKPNRRATTVTLPAVVVEEEELSESGDTEFVDEASQDENDDDSMMDDRESVEEDPHHQESLPERHTRNLQYGTLISCIDFGDQLGALVLGALVGALDVGRDWEHLGALIQVCAVLGACSTVLVVILR